MTSTPEEQGPISVSFFSQTILHFPAEWSEHRMPAWAAPASSDESKNRAMGRLENMLKPGCPQQFLTRLQQQVMPAYLLSE